MSNETLTKNPLEDAEGLSSEERHKQIELGHKALRLNERQIRLIKKGASYAPLEVSRHFGNGVAMVATTIAEKANDSARAYHYTSLEGQHQEQAVKDAAAAGVHTNFGT
jgi:hypothetical protein